MIQTKIDRYLVIGNPIAHSKSPFIHTAFAKQTQQALQYDKQLVEIGKLTEALNQFRMQGIKGVNITVPFKHDAFAYVDKYTDRAKLVGVVNTIKFENDGTSFGDSTDGVGLVRDLTINLKWQLQNKRILIVGAGGAVKAVVPFLLAEKPKELIIVNRTAEKAELISQEYKHLGSVKAVNFSALTNEKFDFIINGTSTGLQNEVPPLPDSIIQANVACYDMFYSQNATPFLQWAIQLGCKQWADGLGMLVEQAAEAFFFWRGVKPETTPVLNALRKLINT